MGRSADPGRGAELRGRRLRAGWSLAEVSGYSGYSRGHLSNVEHGKREASAAVARFYEELPTADKRRAAGGGRPSAGTRPAGPDAAPAPAITWYGAEVRRARQDAGLSLGDLGERTGLSVPYLSKIERGDARGNYAAALKLGVALGRGGRLAEQFLGEHALLGSVPGVGVLRSAGPPGSGSGFGSGSGSGSGSAEHETQELLREGATRLGRLRSLSHEAGPFAVFPSLVEGIIKLYQQAKSVSAERSGRPLWRMAARYAEFLGWMVQEAGDVGKAVRWTDLSLRWGDLAGDPEVRGYALIRRSQMARRAGDAPSAIRFAADAAGVPGISPRIAQFAAQREAQARALAGDRAGFRAAYARYQAFYDRGELWNPGSPKWGPLPDPVLESSRLVEAACLADLGDWSTAAALFAADLGRLDPDRTGHARIAVRAAVVAARVGETDQACETLRLTLGTIRRVGSASLNDDLRALNRTLDRRRADPFVRELLPDLFVIPKPGREQPRRLSAAAPPC